MFDSDKNTFCQGFESLVSWDYSWVSESVGYLTDSWNTTDPELVLGFPSFLQKSVLLKKRQSNMTESFENNIKLVCWIMTMPANHEKKAKHVKATWGRRCNVLLFMSSVEGMYLIWFTVHTDCITFGEWKELFNHFLQKKIYLLLIFT